MKNLIAAVLLLGCGSVWAETVTIDFEELDKSVGLTEVVTKGTKFSTLGGRLSVWNNYVVYGNNEDTVLNWRNDSMMLEQADGSLFSIISIDLSDNSIPGSYSEIGIIGHYDDGTSISLDFSDPVRDQYQTLVFGEEWSDLTRVEFLPTPYVGTMDNVVLTTVPVPAAVWLFGSALGGLGWMRRKAV